MYIILKNLYLLPLLTCMLFLTSCCCNKTKDNIKFVEITEADDVILDVRYASENNSFGKIYKNPVVYLHSDSAKKLNFNLRLYDIYPNYDMKYKKLNAQDVNLENIY